MAKIVKVKSGTPDNGKKDPIWVQGFIKESAVSGVEKAVVADVHSEIPAVTSGKAVYLIKYIMDLCTHVITFDKNSAVNDLPDIVHPHYDIACVLGVPVSLVEVSFGECYDSIYDLLREAAKKTKQHYTDLLVKNPTLEKASLNTTPVNNFSFYDFDKMKEINAAAINCTTKKPMQVKGTYTVGFDFHKKHESPDKSAAAAYQLEHVFKLLDSILGDDPNIYTSYTIEEISSVLGVPQAFVDSALIQRFLIGNGMYWQALKKEAFEVKGIVGAKYMGSPPDTVILFDPFIKVNPFKLPDEEVINSITTNEHSKVILYNNYESIMLNGYPVKSGELMELFKLTNNSITAGQFISGINDFVKTGGKMNSSFNGTVFSEVIKKAVADNKETIYQIAVKMIYTAIAVGKTKYGFDNTLNYPQWFDAKIKTGLKEIKPIVLNMLSPLVYVVSCFDIEKQWHTIEGVLASKTQAEAFAKKLKDVTKTCTGEDIEPLIEFMTPHELSCLLHDQSMFYGVLDDSGGSPPLVIAKGANWKKTESDAKFKEVTDHLKKVVYDVQEKTDNESEGDPVNDALEYHAVLLGNLKDSNASLSVKLHNLEQHLKNLQSITLKNTEALKILKDFVDSNTLLFEKTKE